MDCLHASEIISAALDGEHVDPGSVAHAREHCRECLECRALLETMHRTKTVPASRAPEQLIVRIVEAAREEAQARADAEATATHVAPSSGVVLPLEPVRPRPRIAPAWWKPHFTPLASAAAVVLVVSVVSTYVLVQMTGPASQMTATDTAEITLDDAGAPSDEQALATSPTDDTAALYSGTVQTAPSYVVWEGTVWVRSDGAAPRSSLVPAGTTISDLGGPDGPGTRDVLVSESMPGAIFMDGPDEALIRFSRVTRALGTRTYALTSDTTLTSFGAWPALPSRFPLPAADDGSPTFTAQGTDSRGRTVFVPLGADASQGFALAPGTPPDDPAAGNPNWTWWEPID